MAMERGGRSTKLGNSYERLWAVLRALYVIDGRACSVLWEPVGEDENGIDLWVRENDGTRVGHQLKRENESKEYWSVADLRSAGVLQAAREQLERVSGSRFAFVSSSGARHIRDLAEQSRRANDDAVLFTRDLVAANTEREAAFKTLLTAWGLDPALPGDAAVAFRLLQRMTFEVQERSQAARDEIGFIAGLLIAGDPAGIVATLGDLLDNNLGKELHADHLRKMLLDRGLRVRSLAGDPSLPTAVERLQAAFDSAISGSLIANVPIGRPEVDELLTKVRGEQPPRLVFVHGGAGAGKTVVLHQAFLALRAVDIPCLPVQLHAQPPAGSPDSFGRSKLDLPASPALSLRGLAGERRAVLMLDQLDALRLTSANSHEAWQACSEVIDEALADPNTTVIVACRTFDLENDPKIGAWKQHSLHRPPGNVAEVKIGDLPEVAVAELTGRYQVRFGSLPVRQQRLLRQPGSLALWWSLASAGDLAAVDNATELMRRFLALRRGECTREHRIPESSVATVLSSIVTYMDNHGCLSAPEPLFATFSLTIDALCSVGLLRRDGSKLSFVHQSYFDHFVAEQVFGDALRSGQDPIIWVRANQSLFRRDQLRQLLTLLRDADPTSHAGLVKAVLLAPRDLRFHLKHLVLGLLSQCDPPLDHEVRLVVDLAERPEWWDHIFSSVLWSKPAWFDALERGGHLARWLASWTDDNHLRQLLRFFRSIAAHRGGRVDGLLAPYWDAKDPWARRLGEAATFDPCDDSPRMAALRLRKIRSGEWQINAHALERLLGKNPQQIIPLLEAALLAWVDRMRVYMRGGGERQPPEWRFRYDQLPASVLAQISAEAARAWPAFSPVLRLLMTLRRRARRGVRSIQDIPHMDFALLHRLDEAAESLEALTAKAIEGLAANSPSQTSEFLRSLTVPKTRGLERPIATGLLAGDASMADTVIAWLCDRPSRFHLGDGYDQLYWKPATDLIARFAPGCSQSLFDRLQTTVLAYHDDHERVSMKSQSEYGQQGRYVGNHWGKWQHHLLHAMPADRLSPLARDRMTTWRAKFGDPADELPLNARARGGSITSPIPPDKLRFVSDRVWLDIIARGWPTSRAVRWKQHDEDTVGEASVWQFGRALAEAARSHPRRFARLALRIPPSSNPAYFASLLGALAEDKPPGNAPGWEAAELDELEAVVEHVGDCANAEYVQSVCRLVRSRESARWSDAMIDRVMSYAEHPEPAPDTFTVHRGGRADEPAEPDVGSTAINCVRGAVAGTITHILWSRPDAFERLLPVLDRLMSDGHPSVRVEALGACLPIWNRDREQAVRLFLRACDHPDDRVLESHWVRPLIARARHSHLRNITPIVERMAKSSVEKVAQEGAAWATVCHLQQRALTDVFDHCRFGTVPQRTGVADAAQELGAIAETAASSAPLLAALFDDDADSVRERATRVFVLDGVFDLPSTPDLALAFCRSKAFRDSPSSLLHSLTTYTGNIAEYARAIMFAAEALAGPLAAASRDIQQRISSSPNELSILLLGLYEQAYGSTDTDLQDACLDRWDLLLENRVGLSTELLRKLDD